MRIIDLTVMSGVNSDTWLPVFYKGTTYRVSATTLLGSVTVPLITNQDVEITDATRGFILKSPDGSRWRVTIDNAGTLIRTKL